MSLFLYFLRPCDRFLHVAGLNRWCRRSRYKNIKKNVCSKFTFMDTANNDYYIHCTTFTNMPFKKIIK